MPLGPFSGVGDDAIHFGRESQQQQIRGHDRSPSLSIPGRFPNFLVVDGFYISALSPECFTQCEISLMRCTHGEAGIALFGAILAQSSALLPSLGARIGLMDVKNSSV
jgi:hypothetical protein